MIYLSLLRRFWPYIAIAALLGIVLIQRGTIARKDAKLQHAADVMQINEERIKTATSTFKANAEAEARRIETAQNLATQETASEYSSRLRAALALAASRMRDRQTSGGSASGTGQGGGTSKPTGSIAGAGSLPLVDDDDLLICTENTVKAQGWRSWWLKISAIPR